MIEQELSVYPLLVMSVKFHQNRAFIFSPASDDKNDDDIHYFCCWQQP